MDEIDHITIFKAKKKDKIAFKKIYDFYAPFIWKVAYRTLHGKSEMAQEAVQDTFIKVYNSLKDFSGDSAFSTWIYKITFNVCMTLLKKYSKQNKFLEITDNMELNNKSNVLESETSYDIQKILKSISSEDRFLLVSHELMGFSYEELAQISNISCGAIRTRMCRLKDELKEKFGEDKWNK